MRAMIFAAGLGTRLQPLTNTKPKALVEIHGKPLLRYAIEKLALAGFTDIIINVHHFSEQIMQYLNENKNFGLNIAISDERQELLNTGGGLKKASWFFSGSEPFLVFNVDIISDINLTDLYNYHLASNAMATLSVMERKTSRYLLFNDSNVLCGWQNVSNDELRMVRQANRYKQFAFSGIHVINPSFFNEIEQEGAFSIIDSYLQLAQYHKIVSYNHTGTKWCDLGKHDELAKAAAIVEGVCATMMPN